MSELKTAVLTGHFNPIPSVYSHDLGLVIGRMLTPQAKDRPTAAYVLFMCVYIYNGMGGGL